jgi:hypothetical protein
LDVLTCVFEQTVFEAFVAKRDALEFIQVFLRKLVECLGAYDVFEQADLRSLCGRIKL